MRELPQDLEALNLFLFLEKVDAALLSSLASPSRLSKLCKDIVAMAPRHDKFLGKEICGDFNAMAVFDDNKWICKECLDWGIQAYPICTPGCSTPGLAEATPPSVRQR